ncbi:MAG: sigma-54 dependent transcriptional regulator [Verrucomicrobia bacterium]|nr:sigma-54 dependent transcriptional regulator [Verrucomicrobiota bacterium]MDE3099350.1 sigma-54-dependent Fis family transcriptional regulator [Verrucomicrobiota bacterium]
MKAKVLIVDDERDLRALVATVLSDRYDVAEAASAAALQKTFSQPQPDVVLLDVNLPDAHGLDLLPQIKKSWPETEVIVLTGHGTVTMAVEAGRRGAYNFLTKPFENEKLVADIKCAVDRKQQSEENLTLRRALETMSGTASPVFRSAAMQEVVRTVERVAPSDVPILITGESGSGKEVIADLVHALSPRSKAKIIKINCAALPRELIESELFGSVKGAFTGAHMDREGLFRQAESGTLLLDEISEMPIDTQSKLLRVLQDQEVRPVGGKASYKTNCRILAATNRKPEKAISDGKLREDLFYRISAISVHLPPLRERRDDIAPLANSFLKRFAAQASRNIRGFSADAMERLMSFEWPGNVRQLQNEIQRAVLLCEGDEVAAADLSITNATSAAGMGAMSGEEMDTNFTLLEGVERNIIVQMLKETGGNKVETAKRLGIGRQTLYNKIKAYAIEV